MRRAQALLNVILKIAILCQVRMQPGIFRPLPRMLAGKMTGGIYGIDWLVIL